MCDCNDFSQRPLLSKETVRVRGEWSDYTGSSTDGTNKRVASSLVGATNTLAGTEAARVFGGFNPERNDQGFNSETTRQRDHLEFITIADQKKKRC